MVGIYKTNINTKENKRLVIESLSTHFQLDNCSIDMEDIDKVLRVVATKEFDEGRILSFVKQLGFDCQPL
ncbi:hypothetical protein COR50_20815 [Chitinophaga caeni]|uniref:Uncharacterized protein n=1 Tax=Chitinophaga caeni TaxID=2029983 RepID=A0A291QZT2_9BACT|nr:hypothetical protein [Chitinophaga caeni]ATL49421.1 hypothetical protein COR50_20815 [Chitinophaga caeni]